MYPLRFVRHIEAKKQEIFLGQCYQLALFRTNLDCAADESQKEIVK